MKGFLYAGLIFIVLAVMIFALMSLSSFQDYMGNKIYLKYKADNVYQTTVDAARLISYGRQNIMQDAVSDSVALATELLGSNVANYTYVEINISTPNNITSIIPVIELSDKFPVSCYYKADYVFYIPMEWDLGHYMNKPYFPNWTNNRTNRYWKVMGIFYKNETITRTIPLTSDKYTLKINFCTNINGSGNIYVYVNKNLADIISITNNGSLNCEFKTASLSIPQKGFYNITITSNVSNWGIRNILLEKHMKNNLFIENISKIICIGNDYLSTRVLLCEKKDNVTNTTYNLTIYNYWAYSNWTGSKFIGCINSKILNTSEFINLTNYKNYTWYYLIRNKTLFKNFLINKVLIGYNLSNLSMNISDPKEFTFSGMYSIERAKPLYNPRFDSLIFDLQYYIPEKGAYGGITGTGFENLSCSNMNNFGSKINCEGEPFISGYSSDYQLEKPIQIPLRVCRKLTENNYGLIRSVLKSYSENVFTELLSKTNGRKYVEILDTFIKNYPVNCANITTENGFNFTVNVCVKYKVLSGDFSKESTVCSPRTIIFDFNKKTFGEDTNITTPKGKYAYRIFYKEKNIVYLPNVSEYIDSYGQYNCSIICRENITGIKYTGEKLFYSDIWVIDNLRLGIDPDNGIFEHPFHILTTNYKKTGFYSVCDYVKFMLDSGENCNDISTKIKEQFKYLNDSEHNIITNVIQNTNTSYTLEINVSDNLYPELKSDIRYDWRV